MPKTCVWRLQKGFAEEGVDAVLRDKTRPSAILPLGSEMAGKKLPKLTTASGERRG